MTKKNINTLTTDYKNSENSLTAKEKVNIELFQDLLKYEAGLEALEYFKDLGIFQTDKIILLPSKHSFSYEGEYVSGIRIIFNLKKMNVLPRLSFLFYKINSILPMEGYYIGCYEDINTIKKLFVSGSNKFIGKIWFYLFYYFPLLLNRLPVINLLLTFVGKGTRKRLSFYDVQKIMLRNGFRVVANKEFEGKRYFISKKVKEVNQARNFYFRFFEKLLLRNSIINI